MEKSVLGNQIKQNISPIPHLLSLLTNCGLFWIVIEYRRALVGCVRVAAAKFTPTTAQTNPTHYQYLSVPSITAYKISVIK